MTILITGVLGSLAAIQFSLLSIAAKFRLCWMIYRLATGRQFQTPILPQWCRPTHQKSETCAGK